MTANNWETIQKLYCKTYMKKMQKIELYTPEQLLLHIFYFALDANIKVFPGVEIEQNTGTNWYISVINSELPTTLSIIDYTDEWKVILINEN